MDSEVKQRNRRRKRAQRMQAQRDCKDRDGIDSAEDDSPVRDKPQRPPIRRKRSKEPLVEEDIIDGFAILGFRTYEDLEAVIKLASKAGIRKLTSSVVEEKLKTEKESQRNLSINNHHISAHPPTQHQGLTLTHDPGTSDDSGRASERLTGSSVAPRDPDSSRDRLSDASSRCSSGKGYICDSEGDDDKGSDAGSVLFASAPSTRKLEFPSALSLVNGDSSASPVPAPTPPGLAPPAPSPAAAALPPPQPPQYSTPSSAATNHGPAPSRLATPPPMAAAVAPVLTTSVCNKALTPPSSVPVTMPQPPAAAPVPVAHLPAALDSTADVNHSRTDSPAVATSANVAVAPGSTSQYPAFPSLYAPYAAHSPYTAPSPAPAPATLAPTTSSTVAASMSATVTTTSHRDIVTSSRTHSPRGHSPTRERDSYSSNVSSLSRGSVTPFSTAPPPTTATVSSSLAFSKPTPSAWSTSGSHAPPPQQQQQQQQQQQRPPSRPPSHTAPSSQLSPATSVPRPTPPLGSMHPFPAPMFAPPPLPPPAVSTASPLGLPPNSNPNPFSAESLFQSNQADMLRRELDSRFLASQDRSLNVGPPPYLRTEMHQHQHHHTHVHQHTTPLLPPPPASTLFPTPLFKEIPKMGSVDSPFYRQNIGISSYPAYSPGLLHPGIGGPTPFVPPNHLPTFQPKQPMGDAPKPKPPVKSGKWNAMHVRVAWEIYHHQQKQQSEVKAGAKADMLRPPSHMFPGSLIHSARPHELSFPAGLSGHRPPPTFDHPPHPGSLYSNPASHLGKPSYFVNGNANTGMSPFSRYGTAFNAPSSPFSMAPFPGARELPPLGPMHDPWSRLQRAVPSFPPAPVPQSPWSLKPDPAVLERREQEERERERERERLRREREERERREREEKQRKQLEQQQQERERERERREKERREMERREMERERERERERMLHQQRIAESKQQAAAAAAAMAARDRSPLRNGSDMGEVRVKEEPRTKDDDVVMLSRTTDPRYHHPYLNRHPATLPPHSMLDRSRGMLPPGLGGPPLASHFPPPPPASHWPGPDPFRDPYRFEPLRYNPLMEAAMRAEEERAKIFSAYANHPAHMRGKEPPPAGLMHMRPGPGPGPPPPPHKICATPPTADMHKKDDSSQSR